MRFVARLAARAALLAGIGLTPCAAFAAPPCAGFGDVDALSIFCPNIEWIKNRNVTLGCGVGIYCPTASVTREQMAAFMNRLGTALTPVHLPVDSAPGAIDLGLNVVVCQTQDFAVAGFPRRAYVDASFNGTAPADVGLAADVVMSTNGGASWSNLNTVLNRGVVAANQWGTFSDIGFADLSVGQNVRWGVRITRGGLPGITNLAASRCQLRVLVHSRNGTVSPL
ncbi:MAG TPA: hypothetical protein VNE58_04170 [Casimicrobiaceae bacterium]|nr:hypothetical protein [Casimicrobiaceae bacterium]